ncbi:MAG: TMEM43 family protein [Prevotella sp.]|nr:TMEM43 family protein [Prevotella sp.]
MAYQEVTTTGYGTRVGNSFKAIGSGFLMFVLGTALLWWNEGRAVKTEKMLDEAGNAYVEMENPNKKDASLEGELICGTAMATTEDSLVDAQFGIGAKAISIRRNVEYYQWVEHSQTKREDKLGGKEVTTTTYTYTKEWVSSPIESSDFHDPAYQNKNSVLTTVDESEQWAENVKWGAYTLSESLFHRISSREAIDLAIAEDLLKQFDKSTQAAYERAHGVVNTAINKISQAVSQPAQPVQQPAQVAIPDSIKALLPDSVRAKLDSIQAVTDSLNKQMANAENKMDLQYVHQASNVLYFGRVPGSPEVGDVRVTFEKVVPAKVTIMAVVDGDSFKPYKAKNGKRFQTLVMGKKSGDEIIEGEKEANNMILWALRILGIMIIIGGLKGIFGFLETILKVVPFIAGIFGWGVGIVCTVVGIVWSLIVIALAWLFYRPVLAICLLAIAGFLIWVFAFKGKDKLKEFASKGKNNQTQPAPQKAE